MLKHVNINNFQCTKIHQIKIDSGGSDLMNSAAVPRLPGFSSQRVCSELFLLLGTLESSKIRWRFWRMSSCSATDLPGEILPWRPASEILCEIRNVNVSKSYRSHINLYQDSGFFLAVAHRLSRQFGCRLLNVQKCQNIQSLLFSSMSMSRTFLFNLTLFKDIFDSAPHASFILILPRISSEGSRPTYNRDQTNPPVRHQRIPFARPASANYGPSQPLQTSAQSAYHRYHSIPIHQAKLWTMDWWHKCHKCHKSLWDGEWIQSTTEKRLCLALAKSASGAAYGIDFVAKSKNSAHLETWEHWAALGSDVGHLRPVRPVKFLTFGDRQTLQAKWLPKVADSGLNRETGMLIKQVWIIPMLTNMNKYEQIQAKRESIEKLIVHQKPKTGSPR